MGLGILRWCLPKNGLLQAIPFHTRFHRSRAEGHFQACLIEVRDCRPIILTLEVLAIPFLSQLTQGSFIDRRPSRIDRIARF